MDRPYAKSAIFFKKRVNIGFMVVHKTKVFSEYYAKLISVEDILISEARLLWGNLKTNDGPGGFYSYSSSDDRMRVCRGPSSASTRNT